MGQKVHPYSFRLGYIKDWLSHWYANKKDFAGLLHEDIKLRKKIINSFSYSGISRIDIDRVSGKVKFTIYTAKPGVIIGRRGSNIDTLKEEIQKETSQEIFIDIKEVKNPAVNAQLIAENISFQLTRRVNFRRAMKKAIQMAFEGGVQGIKIACSGRLGGAEMSRRETYKEGKIPLQTIRADIDYGFSEANTKAGLIGVKVWVYNGDILFPESIGYEKSEETKEKSRHQKKTKTREKIKDKTKKEDKETKE